MTSTGKRCEARLELKQLVGMAEVRDEEEIPIDDLLKKYPTDPGVVALYGRYYKTCHVTQKISLIPFMLNLGILDITSGIPAAVDHHADVSSRTGIGERRCPTMKRCSRSQAVR